MLESLRAGRLPEQCHYAVCLSLIACLLSACITHRAVVEQSPEAEEAGSLLLALVVGEIVEDWSGLSQRSHPHPRELPFTLWLRDQQGALLRADHNPQSPRPWWQHFPVDLVTDLWPQEFLCESRSQVRPQPISRQSKADLDQAAQAYGFARSGADK